MNIVELSLWLMAGIVGFFYARAPFYYKSACQPIKVKTIIGMLFLMWIPPATFFAGTIWWICALCEDTSFKWMEKEVFNPCKLFKGDPSDRD